MDSSPEYKPYKNFQGREQKLQVLSERRIGGGEVGEAFEVKARVEGGAEGTFILKRFFDQVIDDKPVGRLEVARQSFKNYSDAREAGLKVFPTFRFNEEDATIIMTVGYNEEWYCVSSNNRGSNSVENFGGKKLESIPNFSELVENAFKEADKATKAGIYLTGDAFFFIVNKDYSKIDFFIGDVDTVQKVTLEEGQDLFSMNRMMAKAALSGFFRANLSEDKGYEYVEKMPRYNVVLPNK